MQVFNVNIFGKDADWFMSLGCQAKKDWIKANTNQTNDDLIDKFVKNCNRGNDDECLDCKKAKSNATNNISSTVLTEEPSVSAIGEDTAESGAVDTPRQEPSSKKGKNK